MTRTPSPKEGLHCILGVAVMDAGLGLEGPALDLRVWTLVESSPALGLPRAPPVQGTRAEQEFPVRGDSTGAALRCAAPPPSQTPAARACGAELGGGRFPCVSAVTSARGVSSRGFPSQFPADFNPSRAGV